MPDKKSATNPASQWATGVSILNGMFGDYLHQQQNGLTIDMAFMHDDRPVILDRASLLQTYSRPSGKLCILIHGLCCNEHSWMFIDAAGLADGTSYGSLLQEEWGFTPLYLRYNTGLPLAENGRRLARLLQELVLAYPVAIEEIVLIGHSMGGLIIRSACEYESAGEHDANSWLNLVGKAFYLGTPHEDVDVEKLMHSSTSVLESLHNPFTRAISDVFHFHQAAFKAEPTAFSADEEDALVDQSRGTAWPDHVQHYLIAGTLNEDPQHIISQLFGDGLVRAPTTSSQHENDDSRLPNEHIKVFPGLHHMVLARDPDVYAQLVNWLMQASR